MDITDPLNMQVTGQFIVKMSPVSTYPAGNTQRALKISAITWVNEKQVPLPRTLGRVAQRGEHRRRQLVPRGYLVRHEHSRHRVGRTLTPEDGHHGSSPRWASPGDFDVVFLQRADAGDHRLQTRGLAILNPNQVAISNDNDFGIGDFPGRSPRCGSFDWRTKLSGSRQRSMSADNSQGKQAPVMSKFHHGPPPPRFPIPRAFLRRLKRGDSKTRL
jgi:hypothetical protein